MLKTQICVTRPQCVRNANVGSKERFIFCLRIFASQAVFGGSHYACHPRHHCLSFSIVICTAGAWNCDLCLADLPCPATGNCPTTRTSHEWDWNSALAWPLTRTRMQVTWGTTLVSEFIQNIEQLRNSHGYNRLWNYDCHVRVRSQFYGTCVRRQFTYGVDYERSAGSECACNSVIFLTLSFRRVLYVMRFLLGISPASEC